MSTRVHVVTTCQSGRLFPSIEKNREHMMSVLDRAMRLKPDLAVLPEAFPTAGIRDVPPEERAEPLPGPTTDAAAKRAREHRCYVICPVKTRRDGRIWNSAVVLDRSGGICGVYDKIHPVTSSPDYTVLESGVAPASGGGIFDLDFGRIGIQICFDVGFPETWESLARQGARMIIWPSAYDGGFPLQAYAWLHHYYVVSSVRSGRSKIIDPLGTILCRTGKSADVASRRINTDFIVSHTDFNSAVPRRILDAHGGRVEIRSEDDANHFLAEPVEDGLSVARLQDEFGFESTQQYHERHREAYRQILAGNAPPPQSARHAARPMHAAR